MFVTADIIRLPIFDNEKVLDEFDFSNNGRSVTWTISYVNVIEYYYPYVNILDEKWMDVLE